MGLNADSLRRLDYLLKQALALPAEARDPWVDRLGDEYADLRPTLRDLLRRHANAETGDLIDRLPQFTDFAPAIDAEAPQPTDLGPYHLLRELGRGGMGAVWLAERTDGVLKRQVALKFPYSAAATAETSMRFARERDILAALVHPNIARLYDAGASQLGQHYIALEYVEGVQITAYCDERSLTVRQRLEIFLQVLSAVQYAHGQLVVHRDLKPSNILVTPDGQVRLLDFGVAGMLAADSNPGAAVTAVEDRALTPDYASPEQIGGQAIGTRSDVYSLGIVLYELLVGTRPYRLKRGSRGELEDAITTVPIRLPSSATDDAAAAAKRGVTPRRLSRLLKGDLDLILAKALKKSPDDRYRSVEAFAQDLQRHLTGLPVLARPDGLWYRGTKFAARHALALGALGIVVLALAAGLSVALWQARIARDEAATATSLKNFMIDIFRSNSSDQPDPIKARATSARDLLDIAASRLGKSPELTPTARLAMLETLMDMYANLRLLDQAADLGRQRLQLVRDLHGRLRPADAELLIELSNYVAPKDPAAARAYLEEAEGLLDRAGDRTSEIRAKLDYVMAQMTASSGQVPRAETYAEESVAIGRAHAAHPDPDFPLSMRLVQLAQIERTRGEYGAAVRSLGEALSPAVAGATRDKSHQPTLYWTLGTLQYLSGNYRDAEQSFRSASRLAREFGQAGDLETVQSDMRLASFLVNTSRMPDGLPMLRDGLAQMIHLRGLNDGLYVPLARAELGRALGVSGRLEEGHAALAQALDTMRGTRPKSNMHAGFLLYDIPLLIGLGRLPQAQEEIAELEAMPNAITGELVALHALAKAALALAREQPAEAAQAMSEQPVPPDAAALLPGSLPIEIMHARIAFSDKGFDTAYALASATLSRIKASPDKPYLGLWLARAELIAGQSALAMGNRAAALPLLEQAKAAFTTIVDATTSPELADAATTLAQALHAAQAITPR